jgi:hypothetical protein
MRLLAAYIHGMRLVAVYIQGMRLVAEYIHGILLCAQRLADAMWGTRARAGAAPTPGEAAGMLPRLAITRAGTTNL